MDRSVMLERLEWLSKAPAGCETPEWLHEGDGTWAGGIRAVTGDALVYIARLEGFNAQLMETLTWRPIAEAPIPAFDPENPYWSFPCLLQTEGGIVAEGFVRYVDDNRRKGRKTTQVLRWYIGANDRPRDTRVCPDPKYFMPLPAKRED